MSKIDSGRLIVVRYNLPLSSDEEESLYRRLLEQKKNGLMLLPDYCDLWVDVPHATDILVEGEE